MTEKVQGKVVAYPPWVQPGPCTCSTTKGACGRRRAARLRRRCSGIPCRRRSIRTSARGTNCMGAPDLGGRATR